MEINIKLKPSHVGIFEKITLFLGGVFVSCLIFALFTQNFGQLGIWLGLIASVALIFCGFYYVEKGKRLRVVTWGMLSALILLMIGLIIGLIMVSDYISSIFA